MKRSIFIILFFSSATYAQQRLNVDDPITIMEFVEENGSFQTLKNILLETRVDYLLRKKGQAGSFTLFAPTDTAFSQFGRLGLLRGKEQTDKERFKEFVNYYILKGKISRKKLKSQARTLKTLSGEGIDPKEIGRVKYSIDLNNGVIHVIDHVLVNPTLKEFVYVK